MRFSFPARFSLKQTLFGYMLVLASLLLLAMGIGLFLLGKLNSTKKHMAQTLSLQMEVFEKDMISYWEDAAALGIDLSEEMTSLLEQYLQNKGLTFSMLEDSETALTELQETMLSPVCQKLLQSDCSGAFVLLDATVNSSLDNAEYSRSGLYIQKSGTGTASPHLLLYRGWSDIGKRHGLMPHRQWALEFSTDQFPDYEEHMQQASLPLTSSYRLTGQFILPGTSEQAALMTVPLIGKDRTVYGLCGFEVSQSHFKQTFAQSTTLNRLICFLTLQDQDLLDPDTGFICGTSHGYFYAPNDTYLIRELSYGLVSLSCSSDSYIGMIKPISLSFSSFDPSCRLAVMVPKEDYHSALWKSRLQVILLLLLLIFFAALCCLYFSRRFLTPILTSLSQVTSGARSEYSTSVSEIKDLFAYLDEQDRIHEEVCHTLVQEKLLAETESRRLMAEYEEAQNKYEDAKSEIARLAYYRKQEIDPDDYQRFLDGLQTLTASEQKIFDYYLSGKNVKEIMELSGIKESTVRYHNRNIYSKLGVNSLKQLLRCATLMQQEDGSADARR